MSPATRLRLGMPLEHYHYVYILQSEKDPQKHYIGRTDNLHERLRTHNRGHCEHTRKHVPWAIETAIAFRSRTKALSFESYLKKGSGREFSKRHF